MKKEFLEDKLPPFLKDFRAKGEGFKTPEGYFEGLEDAVFSRLEKGGDLRRPVLKVAKRPGLLPAFIRPRAAMALAAALALMLAAVWFFRQNSGDMLSPLAAAELSEEDLETYLLENAHEFDPEQLAAIEPEETPDINPENDPAKSDKNTPPLEEIHPDDLDKILDDMTDDELEEIL